MCLHEILSVHSVLCSLIKSVFVFIAPDPEETGYFGLLFGCVLLTEENTVTSHKVLKVEERISCDFITLNK